MKARRSGLVPLLFALAGALFLIPALKPLLTGGSLDDTDLVLALACGVLAIAFGAVGRRSGGGPGRPGA
jgi:hypothetical protein